MVWSCRLFDKCCCFPPRLVSGTSCICFLAFSELEGAVRARRPSVSNVGFDRDEELWESEKGKKMPPKSIFVEITDQDRKKLTDDENVAG